MMDIHSHILPEIDDGASCLEESIAMLREARKVGITAICATPHAKTRMDWDRVNAAFHGLESEAAKMGIQLTLGAELMYDLLTRLTTAELDRYCYQGTKTFLLELPTDILPPKWECTLSELKQAGYRAIIAHPERYRFVQSNLMQAFEFHRYGALLQLDAESFALKWWDKTHIAAHKLLQQGAASFIASDAHSAGGYRIYGEIRQKSALIWPAERMIG
jgi:protein-tyrosine phosphatase